MAYEKWVSASCGDEIQRAQDNQCFPEIQYRRSERNAERAAKSRRTDSSEGVAGEANETVFGGEKLMSRLVVLDSRSFVGY